MASEVVLKAPARLRVVALVLVVVSLSCLVRGLAPLLAVPSLLVSSFFTIATWNRWKIDVGGVERRFPLLKRVWVAWSAVTSIDLEPSSGNVILRNELGPPLELSVRMAGAHDLYRFLLAHAPASALRDAVRRTLQARLDGSPTAGLAIGVLEGAPEPVSSRDDAATRWRDNPFFVLDLSPECSRADVERAGQKLLALLAIDSGTAKRFATPVGEVERTPERVRMAMSELRDPERRIVHEMWAHVGSRHSTAGPAANHRLDTARPWSEALAAIGWRRR